MKIGTGNLSGKRWKRISMRRLAYRNCNPNLIFFILDSFVSRITLYFLVSNFSFYSKTSILIQNLSLVVLGLSLNLTHMGGGIISHALVGTFTGCKRHFQGHVYEIGE